MSALGAFNQQLLRFFKELAETYPEEREIVQASEGLEAAKKINPKLILDLFNEYVYKPLNEAILREDDLYVIEFARAKIATQFNEMSPALLIFDKHWGTMTEANQKSIWNYLKVLCILCKKAIDSRPI
jgi:hypothetical protein